MWIIDAWVGFCSAIGYLIEAPCIGYLAFDYIGYLNDTPQTKLSIDPLAMCGRVRSGRPLTLLRNLINSEIWSYDASSKMDQ